MKLRSSLLAIILAGFSLLSCTRKTVPYDGPTMRQKDIQKTFQPILSFMDANPGITFADVGASNGAITVMMATLMDRSEIYIQDIDTMALNKKNLDKILDHCSKQAHDDLRGKNKFYIVIGDTKHTKLPDASFDIIYTNATVHVFTDPDAMLTDLRGKLKPTGKLFVRDSFKDDHGAGAQCSDPSCARPLYTIDEFLIMMKRNGFNLVKQSSDMSGYPVFGFEQAK